MKRAIIVIFCSLAVIISGFVGADHYVTHLYHELETSPYGGWNDIFHKEINSDYIIMGSSRAYAQFNPAILDSILNINSYNLGYNGRQVRSQLLKYKIYRTEQTHKPKVILYELSPYSFSSYKKYESFQFVPYLQKKTMWNTFHEIEGFTWTDKYVPYWRYRNYKNEIRRIRRGTSPYCKDKYKTYKGFCSFDYHWNNKFDSTETLYYLHNKKTIQAFNQFINECEKDDIKVIFILSPYYIKATENIKNKELMHQQIEKIAMKHQIPILDYTQHPISYDTAYFYNYSHLNRKGANLFTTVLAHDLDSLLDIR